LLRPSFWHGSRIHLPHQPVRANFPAHQEVCHGEKKRHGAKAERSLHIAQAGAQEIPIPKTNFSDHYPPARARKKAPPDF
jgi:hypothetical protein